MRFLDNTKNINKKHTHAHPSRRRTFAFSHCLILHFLLGVWGNRCECQVSIKHTWEPYLSSIIFLAVELEPSFSFFLPITILSFYKRLSNYYEPKALILANWYHCHNAENVVLLRGVFNPSKLLPLKFLPQFPV